MPRFSYLLDYYVLLRKEVISMSMQHATIVIKHKDGKTIIENDRGKKWSWTHLDDITAIASVCFFTLKTRFEQHLLYSDNFEIKFTIDESIYVGKKHV